ncbi:MAG: hypothetical protein LBK73_15295 [Treponema sp.]|jgi:hypothetical protein|nr:hypothetical protein [Treponema sp.]
MKNMPIRIMPAVLCIGFLAIACDPEAEEEKKNIPLIIENNSSYTISNVRWKDNSITGNYGSHQLSPKAEGRASVQCGSDYLYFTREGTVVMNLRTANTITVNATTRFTLTDATMVVDTTQETNTGALSSIKPPMTTFLTIKNESFSDLMDVRWQGVAFRSNAVESSIPIGSAVTAGVEPGASYIFFKRKSNPAFARTKEVVVIEKSETKEFVFIDNTLIVEANNPDNTGALKDMTTTVVFFDDAEGEIQGYAERKGSTYYSVTGDLPYYGGYTYYHPPYAGAGKSIALGGIADAKLRLSLNLERKAKLSFRYANKDYENNTKGAAFSIDGTQKETWQGNYNWSYLEYTLEPGSHEIVWTKHGYYTYSTYTLYTYYTYLSLDNILVFYIE